MALRWPQQRLVVQVPASTVTGAVGEMLMLASHADSEHAALHRNRPYRPVALDAGVLPIAPFAKHAVAFPKMSRCSILTRANSPRSRLISICSALTGLMSGP
ncbi:MAG: hypothetical protein EBY24_12300 [Betaproteobacteria bacterium]|nr:hypothetical protein [Betaproteobacteria bacterium]